MADGPDRARDHSAVLDRAVSTSQVGEGFVRVPGRHARRLVIFDEAGAARPLVAALADDRVLVIPIDEKTVRAGLGSSFFAVIAARSCARVWQLVSELTDAGIETLIVTPHPDLNDEVRAIEAVAAGLIDAELPAQTLRRAVLAAWSGQLAFRRAALGAYLCRSRQPADAFGDCGLTARQRQLLPYLAAGATDKEISASLGIAYTTVQKHLANIRKRLGAANRAEVVFLTIQSPATAA